MQPIIGHRETLELLQQMHKRGRLSHALLFVGPKHVGKRTLAEALAKEFGIANTAYGMHPDYVVLEREENDKGELKKQISVEQVRSLRSRLQMRSTGGWKVALIDEVEMLSDAAANALLKTLEEPTAQTLLILLAPSVASVPATIVSRCQVVYFPLVPHARMVEAFGEVLARRAHGRPGLAIHLKDEEFAQDYEQKAGTWHRLLKATLAQKLGILQNSLRDWDALELLDVWEREAHGVFFREPTTLHAELLVRMMQSRNAILGNVNNALAIEQIFL